MTTAKNSSKKHVSPNFEEILQLPSCSYCIWKKKEWKDGKQVETAEDNIINDTTPLWTRKPSELSDEDYKSFYSKLYPMSDEPLFWIHPECGLSIPSDWYPLLPEEVKAILN